MDSIVVGLDVSTTACKAIAVDRNGHILMRSSQPIPLLNPQSGFYEQDANAWWRAASAALREITRQIDPKRIKALSVSNQRETFVTLDKDSKPLRPAIIWLDERCKDEVEPFALLIGREKIHHITGKPVDYAPVVYRLAWMKKHETDLYNNISMICDVHSWLAWKLTDTFASSWASADPLGIFDMTGKKWSKEILAALDLNENQLPKIFRPGTTISAMSDKAAAETGLHKDTMIIAGAGDGQAAGLGVNALDPQRAYLNLGTAVVAGIYNSDYMTHEAFRTMCACADNGYYYECSLRAGTFAIDWFINNILAVNSKTNTEIYSILEDEAQHLSAAEEGLFFLPYLNGVMNPYWDINARGAFTGLSSSHKRGHMYRAILEGIAFEQLQALTAVEDAAQIEVKQLIAIGGGATSSLWCNILANITAKEICLPRDKEASGLGAAICAAMGAGWYPSFKEAAQNMTSFEKVIKPNSQQHMDYLQDYGYYKKIYHNLKSK